MPASAYEKVYEKLRQEIISGVLPFGTRLPGKRPLSEQYGVSVPTVAHALDMLADEGFIQLRERSGSYVSYQSTDDFHGVEPPYSFSPLQEQRSSVDVDGFPFTVLARTMRRVISEQENQLLLKTPNQGLLSFRQALSRYLSRSRGIIADPEQIVVGAGAEYLYGQLVETLGVNHVWAIESPSYEKIEQVYSSRHVKLDPLPLCRNGIRSEALWRSDATILHISPYRSFPSNVTASASKRAEYLRWGARPGHIIIEDDFESEFSIRHKPMDTLFSQSGLQNVIYLNTFSRTISSAIRTGYMVLPATILPLYLQNAGFYSCTVPAFEQYVLAELIDSGDFERHIRRVRRKLRAALGL